MMAEDNAFNPEAARHIPIIAMTANTMKGDDDNA
jgi:CheY-like chemotaxis protein